jgi:hypothetical protein
MPFISPQPKNPKEEEKYRIVDEILSCSSDYYRLLGVKKDSTAEEIRRAYIKV